ncbi:hypothetical protein PybrP1_011695 [[Pythium] brassicae (nom. inval.)]|nr:hypothetical protein PybrP1_011695 [[Pythium] brassicae (nom. inval.)]
MEIELGSMLPTDWRDWDDASLDAIGGLDVDLGAFEDDFGFDELAAAAQHTLASPPPSPDCAMATTATAAASAAPPAMTPAMLPASEQQQQQLFFFAQSGLRDEDEELLALADGEVFMCEQEHDGVLSEHMFKCESFSDLHGSFAAGSGSAPPTVAAVAADAPLAAKRKRCAAEPLQPRVFKEEPVHSAACAATASGKKLKPAKLDEQAERLYRRRYDILHEILEAWNTGGIEDMEEIADSVYDDDVTLISPDYADGLRGVHALMNHWNLLLDAFPDGIMEEYEIQRVDGERLKASWVFSGTQIFPFYGVQPRHEKVCVSGTSFFSFKGDKIRQVVLSWNYREALMKLMGVAPSKAYMVPAYAPGAGSEAAGSLAAYASAVAQVAAALHAQR